MPSENVLKEFLIGIGFKVDQSSFGKAQDAVSDFEETLKKIAPLRSLR
jgi:hypothetical protein